MEFFEPTHYHHQHPQYHHEQLSHYSDVHHTYAMAQSAPMMAMPNVAKANETKPRLGKDEVDILEREFKKNPKPTTQTKRQFAEEMGVDLARINNWFQNRRAKRKQEKKQEANEAGRAQDAMGFSEPSSPDFYSQGSGYYSDNSQVVPVQQPSAQFSLPNGPPPPVAPCNPQYTDPSTASMESFHRTMAAAQAASGNDDFHNFAERQDSIFEGSIHDFSSSDRAQFPSPEDSVNHFNIGQAYSYPSSFSNSLYIDPSRSQSITQVQSPGDESNHTPTPFSNFQNVRQEASVPQLMTTFPSQLLPSQCHDGLLPQGEEPFTQSPESIHESTLPIGFTYDCAESDQSSMSPPPGSSVAFRSPPPPMDIASRRKKVQVKPAALVADTLRGRPSLGPRTVSHAEGLRRPTESPASSPMRRIVSAGGNRNNVLNGRIQKSGIESSQRSPINFGGFADAGSFLEYNQQNIRHPSLTAGSSLSSSLAPPTPMSPREREMTFPKMDSTRSTASPIEGGVNFVFNAAVPGCFTTMDGDQNLASPPETPQAHPLASSNSWANGLELYDVPDEPLYTPAQDSFPMEIHMPQPLYLGNMSQPVTPAFGHFNPNFMFGHESPQFQNEPTQYTLSTQSGSEYSFPESNQHYLATSPTATKQKTFQFSHTTAADFSEK
ncbi:hypothetical protein VTL71DRAFT_1846 [Oculimacula yallundae]|uniref:Homeobox domain-containing protein n=1 Tax=Oculimacula yallundae TaxID=86028 RepID=A0ABR4CBU8_9HELO